MRLLSPSEVTVQPRTSLRKFIKITKEFLLKPRPFPAALLAGLLAGLLWFADEHRAGGAWRSRAENDGD